MEFRPANELRDIVSEVVERWTSELRSSLPGAEVVHTGGTSAPGALTRGDVDLHVRVAPADFARARGILERRYESYRPEMWTDGFAAFVVTEERRLPTGIALTAVDGEHDRRFVRGWELMLGDPQLLAEYNALKERFAGTDDENAYGAAKSAFFSELADT